MIDENIDADEIPGLPRNKVFTTEDAIPALIEEIRRIRARLSSLEGKK